MLEEIILEPRVVHTLVNMMDDNHEYMGQLFAEITNYGIYPVEGIFARGSELDTSIDPQIKQKFLQILNYNAAQAKAHPERYAIIDVHTHGRAFGEKIKIYDPYWSIARAETHKPGSIVEGKFYVSTLEGSDDVSFERIARRFQAQQIPFYHLFVHPTYGSEGTTMSRYKVAVTAYKYNPSNTGKVEEISVKIIRYPHLLKYKFSIEFNIRLIRTFCKKAEPLNRC